jgi:hypothetical protein
MDGLTDITKLTVALCNFANAPKKEFRDDSSREGKVTKLSKLGNGNIRMRQMNKSMDISAANISHRNRAS